MVFCDGVRAAMQVLFFAMSLDIWNDVPVFEIPAIGESSDHEDSAILILNHLPGISLDVSAIVVCQRSFLVFEVAMQNDQLCMLFACTRFRRERAGQAQRSNSH